MTDKKSDPSPRTRVTRPDTAVEEPKGEKTGGEPGQPVAQESKPSDAGDTALATEGQEQKGDAEAIQNAEAAPRGRPPYHSDGPNVIDSQGRSICVVLDGDLETRAKTAAWIAECLAR